MGKKYNMSADDIKFWRYIIYKELMLYKTTGVITHFLIAIVWLYEYMEAVNVNGQDVQATFERVEQKYKCKVLVDFLRLRKAIVHNVSNLSSKDFVLVFEDNKNLDTIFLDLGFEVSVCKLIYNMLTKETLTKLDSKICDSYEELVDTFLSDTYKGAVDIKEQTINFFNRT